VYGEQGLIGFCGGVEFNADRITPPPPRKTGFFASADQMGDGGPLHDVHCRIEGPASFEIAKIFIQRWNDHPDRMKIENPKNGKPPLIIPQVPSTTPGEHIVQVGRTFGRSNYGFAPPRPSAPQGGETTAGELIANAIRKAKRYIYTEDQYFVGAPLLEKALLEALPNIEHFTAVITFWSMTGMPFVNEHRRKFINKLRTVGGDKVRIFSIQHYPKSDKAKSKDFYDGFEHHTYVHTKAWVIDDEFAAIGSINSDRRGWTHDCEVTAGIYERSTDQFLHYRFAHWLRIKLWQEHLGLQEAELADGRASAVHWLQRPETAVVRPYNLNETNSVGENDLKVPVPLPFIPTILNNNQYVWDHFVDPE
jgi:phosphatidylserine/phosphatidylglycerophosphate/cardiolipin synthase-like enzyme